MAREADEAARRKAEEDKAKLAAELEAAYVAQLAQEQAEKEAARLAAELEAMKAAQAAREKAEAEERVKEVVKVGQAR